MLRFFLVSMLFLATFVFLSQIVSDYPGYILIAVAGKTIEMQAWTGILLIGFPFIVVCIYLFSKLLRNLGHIGKRLWIFNAYLYKSEELTTRGMSHFIEGNWKAAKKDFLKAAAGAKAPVAHLLAAARSAHEAGDKDTAHEIIRLAEQKAGSNELSIMIAQASIYLADKEYEACLALLNKARTLSPKHPTLLNLLRAVYFALNDWEGLQSIMPLLEKQKLITSAQKIQLEERIYLELLCAAGEKLADDQDTQLAAFYALWTSIPKALKNNTALTETYVRYLLKVGNDEEAETVIRTALKDNWSTLLVEKYGLIQTPAPQNQIATAKAWQEAHPKDAALALTLARLSLRNQAWGEAQAFLEESIRYEPTPAAHAELGRLLASLGHYDESSDSYESGLNLFTQDLPELPQPTV